MIEEYQIVIDTDPASLQAKVNDLIKQGWQPHGSLTAYMFVESLANDGISRTNCYPEFCQPMVKKGKVLV